MIQLKAIQKEHVAFFYEWIQDEQVVKYSLSIFQKINSKKDIDKWFAGLLENADDFTRGIFLKDTNQFIGYCGICNISTMNKSGEYFIFIGDKENWGKGVSTEATKQVVDIGFTQLHLNRIMLTVSKPNIGGVKSYKKRVLKRKAF